MSRNKTQKAGRRALVLAVLLLAAAVFLATLNRRPVPTIDGAVYASVARGIIKTGVWFPNEYQGRLFAEHPPLYVWSIAASMKAFGVNDFAANLPMHLFAFLTVCLTALIARRAGLSRGVALASALTLCLTRDFVLSSVRGYIEPLLSFFIYAGLWCALTQFRRRTLFWSVAAALCVAGAWLSKGPPALWPTLFFPLLFIWKKSSTRMKVLRVSVYVATLALCGAVVAWALNRFGGEAAWAHYFNKQVMGSALTGRGGAQGREPLYFVHILYDYYKPWLFFLALALWGAIREVILRARPKKQIPGLNMPAEALFPQPLPAWIFLLFGLGFVGGFSLMPWKFWYYIAPAYPAFALAIGAAVYQKAAGLFERPWFFRFVASASGLWLFATAVFPIVTWRDRVPEVTAFRGAIAGSPVAGPVLFLNGARDHNLVATSGEWAFDGREVRRIASPAEAGNWPQRPAWLMTSEAEWAGCENPRQGCPRTQLIQRRDEHLLLLLH